MEIVSNAKLVVAFTGRVNKKFVRRPSSIVFAMAQPVTWIIFIGWVADESGAFGQNYLQFFAPTALLLSLLYASLQGGIGTAMEMEAGLARRFIYMGAPAWTLYVGRALSDVSKGLLQGALLVALSTLLGAPLVRSWASLGMLAVVCLSTMLLWLGLSNAIGVIAGRMETVFTFAGVALPVVLLVSGAFVSQEQLPQPIRALAWVNPAAWQLSAIRSCYDGAVLLPGLVSLASAMAGIAILVVVARRTMPKTFYSQG